jgi:hypothetical protein
MLPKIGQVGMNLVYIPSHIDEDIYIISFFKTKLLSKEWEKIFASFHPIRDSHPESTGNSKNLAPKESIPQ